MALYRKKPVVIEAVQVTPDMRRNFGPFPDWALPHLTAGRTEKINNSEWIAVKTLEGELNVSDHDYLIQGVNGEVYPCKPDIFKKTYEAEGSRAVVPCPACQQETRWNMDWDTEDGDGRECICSLYTCDDCEIDIDITRKV